MLTMKSKRPLPEYARQKSQNLPPNYGRFPPMALDFARNAANLLIPGTISVSLAATSCVPNKLFANQLKTS
jgi:hypothetical protein